MRILLMGRWGDDGNLYITESMDTSALDDAGVNALVAGQSNDDGMAWAASFDVATHDEAIKEAKEEYLTDEDADLIDQVGQDPKDEETCDYCDESTADNEGYDGACGNCADIIQEHVDKGHKPGEREDCPACKDPGVGWL